MDTNVKKIAADVGFDAFKVSAIIDNQLHSYTLRSVVGVGDTNLGQLQPGITRQKNPRVNTFSTGNQTLLVGPGVEFFTRPITRLDLERVAPCVENEALTFVSISNLLSNINPNDQNNKNRSEVISLIIALPVQVLQGPDAKQVIQSLETWLIGSHSYCCNGTDWNLTISSIKVMAQPLGSFFEWGLDLNGEWQRSVNDLRSSVAILDQGFNTTDLFHLNQGQIVKRYTGGETLGQRRAAKIMKDLMEQKFGKKMSLQEADNLLRNSNSNSSRSEQKDLRDLSKQALDVAASELKSYISQLWEDGKQFDKIILTGGGTIALGNRLRSIFTNAIELPDPVTANARGLARFAQRKGIF